MTLASVGFNDDDGASRRRLARAGPGDRQETERRIALTSVMSMIQAAWTAITSPVIAAMTPTKTSIALQLSLSVPLSKYKGAPSRQQALPGIHRRAATGNPRKQAVIYFYGIKLADDRRPILLMAHRP